VRVSLCPRVYVTPESRFLRTLKYNWWKYLILGVVDVEANFLMVLAYRYTNLTSVQVEPYTSRVRMIGEQQC
jgi:hypothetical protein